MKNISLSLFIALINFLLTNNAAAQNTVQKNYCMSAVGSENIDTLKKRLVANVKRDAAGELFGELITSFTKIEKGLLTEDELKLASAGFIRIKGNPVFTSGKNIGEVCVSVDAYATDEDRKKFDPIKITNKYCATNPELTTGKIKEYAKDQSIITALKKYNRILENYSKKSLLRLVHEVKYLEEGFIPETETYCSKMEGFVYPIEVLGLLSSTSTGGTVSKDSVDSASTSKSDLCKKILTATGLHSPYISARKVNGSWEYTVPIIFNNKYKCGLSTCYDGSYTVNRTFIKTELKVGGEIGENKIKVRATYRGRILEGSGECGKDAILYSYVFTAGPPRGTKGIARITAH